MIWLKLRYSRLSQIIRIALIIITASSLLYLWYFSHGKSKISSFINDKREIKQLSNKIRVLNVINEYKDNKIYSNELFKSKNDNRLISIINNKQSGIDIKEFIPGKIEAVAQPPRPNGMPYKYERLFTTNIQKATIVFSLEGNYSSVNRYLKILESSRPTIFFDRISVVVKSYPLLLVNIMCHYYYKAT